MSQIGDENNVLLELDDSTKVIINLHGATIISWVCRNEERLFLSKKAIFDKKKAIRGGVPIVFPNFGSWDGGRPQHGFARCKLWSLKESPEKTSDSIKAIFSLTDDDETRNMWNFKFELIFEVILTKNSLQNTLTVINLGINKVDFDFTCLLHTYLLIPNIDRVSVSGFNGSKYVDKVDNSLEKIENNEYVKINSEVDRVYKMCSDSHSIFIDSKKEYLTIKKLKFNDTVLWNPWIEKASKMTDFDTEEYKTMICIEPGYIAEKFYLKSNEKISLSQELIVV